MSALAEQHERWSGARERLWKAPPPPPKPSRIIPAVSPFVRERRANVAAQREALDRRIAANLGLLNGAPQEPSSAPEWPAYLPPVIYDHCAATGNGDRTKTMREIIREVADKHKMTVAEIKSARRSRYIILARHEAIWRCKKETSNSLPAIGRAFGGFDHTTILNAIRKHEMRMMEAANG